MMFRPGALYRPARHRATVIAMNASDAGADMGRAAGAGAGRDPPDQARLRQLADEQAALRRVATMVAGGARPAEVLTAVADELGRLIGAEATFVSRVDLTPGEHGELEGHLTVVGSYGRVSDLVPVGFRIKLQPGMIHTAALRTGRPTRINGERLAKGPFGAIVGELGLRAAVGTPIIVGGRHWGVTVAATSREDFPAGTESRMADFMELAATAIANAKAGQELRELADTQAALRRLATLVAQGAPPEAVFAAATREALQYFGSGTAAMIRYEPDGTTTLLAYEGSTGPDLRAGDRREGYPPAGLTATVLRTGQAARVEDYRDVPGGEFYLRAGLRSGVATPIHVNGRLWGMIAVGSGEGPLPDRTEQRMSEFTDLVATAVANAQNRSALEASRDELTRLLEEQAALHRVATLVARGIDPTEIFSAVAGEIRQLLGADHAGIGRFEPDGTAVVVVGSVGKDPVTVPTGTRVELRDYLPPAVVWRTGRSARVDEDQWSSVPDPVTDGLRKLGIRSVVASPIIVEGRLWGVVTVLTTRRPFPPDIADRLADFTELVATAVGNAESRAELPPRGRGSSRRRIRPGGGSSGTCTTGPSNAWSRSASSFASRKEWYPLSCVSSRRRLSGSLTNSTGWWRICARSPAASIRRSCPRAGWVRPCARWRGGPRLWSSSMSPRSPGSRSRSRWRRITSSPRPSQTRRSTRTRRLCASRSRNGTTACTCRFATTARAAPIPPAARA